MKTTGSPDGYPQDYFLNILPFLEGESTPPQIVETIATTLGILRQTRAVLAAESITSETSKGKNAAHPALDIVVGSSGSVDAEEVSPSRSGQSWAMLIKRVYEVDSLSCPQFD